MAAGSVEAAPPEVGQGRPAEVGQRLAKRPALRLLLQRRATGIRPADQLRRLRLSVRRLGVTPEQRERMRAVVKEQQPQLRAIAERQRTARQAMQQARRASPVDQTAVRQQIEELKTIRAELAAARKGLRDGMIRLLAPDQLEKLKAMRRRAQERFKAAPRIRKPPTAGASSMPAA